MQLTPEQYAAAKACGFAFFPATEAQVQRLTMQRRIFWVAAKPFMVTCNGAFYETHGTLLRQIDDYLHRDLNGVGEPQEPSQQPGSPPGCAAAQHAAPEPVTSVAALVQARQPGDPDAEPSTTWSEPPVTLVTATSSKSSVHASMPVQHEVGRMEQGTEPHSAGSASEAARPTRGCPRLRRLGQPKAPRWATAGKARRGRLK